jgi:hypothetical protein
MASRKEQKEALRAERERKEADAKAAARRRQLIGYAAGGGLVLVAVVVVVVVIAASGGGSGSKNSSNAAEPVQADAFPKGSIPPAKASTLETAAKAANCEVKQWPSEGRQHTNGPYKYKTNPPTSGNHFEIPAADGAYTKAPNIGALVHELEHGRIIIWYQPNAPAALIGQAKALFDEDSFHMVLAPNETKMPYQIAESAWTRSITCPTVTDATWDALRLFRDRYRDQGPEKVA